MDIFTSLILQKQKNRIQILPGSNEDDAIDFEERPIPKRYFDEAIELGINIARLPRISGLVYPEVDAVRFKQEGENLSKYLDTVSKVARNIEEKGAISHILGSMRTKMQKDYELRVKDNNVYSLFKM